MVHLLFCYRFQCNECPYVKPDPLNWTLAPCSVRTGLRIDPRIPICQALEALLDEVRANAYNSIGYRGKR